MPTIVAAAESQVLLDSKPIEGVRSIEYRSQQARANIYALGSAERVGVVTGPSVVEGRLTVASASAALNGLTTEAAFQLSAQFAHGKGKVTVDFHDCFLLDRSFALAVGEFGETVYTFSATRVDEKFE
jgi:hypothetical protein